MFDASEKIPWMNRFNKTEAVMNPMQAIFPKDFPVLSDLLNITLTLPFNMFLNVYIK